MTLRQLRQQRGMKQSDIAEKIMVTPEAVRLWENGLRTPSKLRRKLLNKMFDCEIDW